MQGSFKISNSYFGAGNMGKSALSFLKNYIVFGRHHSESYRSKNVTFNTEPSSFQISQFLPTGNNYKKKTVKQATKLGSAISNSRVIFLSFQNKFRKTIDDSHRVYYISIIFVLQPRPKYYSDVQIKIDSLLKSSGTHENINIKHFRWRSPRRIK
jgi:hypothetical protein